LEADEQGKDGAPSSGDGFICGGSPPSVTALMNTTARAVAENFLQKGSPIRAACTLLAINDVQVRQTLAFFHAVMRTSFFI
jgi:hypothetical protein